MKSQAFKLKGRLYTFTVLHIINGDPLLFANQLDEVIAKAPLFFNKTPIVLDCSELGEEILDLQALCLCMRLRDLFPVAIQGANAVLSTAAISQGLAVLKASSIYDKSLLNEEPVGHDKSSIPAESFKTKLQLTPVRSGQQLVSTDGDLIILSSVSPGAELLAKGNIHIYGALRGRALAGISGDKEARIFCQSLEAELVSIAGVYSLNDATSSSIGPCQIYLADNRIRIDPLC